MNYIASGRPIYAYDPARGYDVLVGYACEDHTFRVYRYSDQNPFVNIKGGYGVQVTALQEAYDVDGCIEVLVYVDDVLKARRSVEEVMATESDDLGGHGLQWFVRPPDKAPMRLPKFKHLERGK